MIHPADLRNGTYKYKEQVYQISDYYWVDGQLVFLTDSKKIIIEKSVMKKELKRFTPVEAESRTKNILGDQNGIDPIKPTDPPADHYYGTRNYEKFIYNEKNRVVNKAHVYNLIQSIKENDLLFAQPILVNDRYEVIDGQHRLKAAENLGKRIYYIIKPGLSIEDAIALNVNTKNWSYKDYLQYWIKQGHENYIYFETYLNKYGISYSLSAGLLHKGEAVSGNTITQEFNNGRLEINHQEYAERIGNLILELSKFSTFTNDRSFVIALHQAIKSGEFDSEIFRKKVELCPDKFTKCSDTESYLRMMEDVINYHGHGKRIRLY